MAVFRVVMPWQTCRQGRVASPNLAQQSIATCRLRSASSPVLQSCCRRSLRLVRLARRKSVKPRNLIGVYRQYSKTGRCQTTSLEFRWKGRRTVCVSDPVELSRVEQARARGFAEASESKRGAGVETGQCGKVSTWPKRSVRVNMWGKVKGSEVQRKTE